MKGLLPSELLFNVYNEITDIMESYVEEIENKGDYISDCVDGLDFIDNLPFLYQLTKMPNGGILFRFYGGNFEDNRYFKLVDYNKYILPIIKRILKNDSIIILDAEVWMNVFNTIEYANLIDKLTGEFIMDIPKKFTKRYIGDPSQEIIKSRDYLYDVSILFK